MLSFLQRFNKDRAAILVINGKNDPAEGRWLDLCLGKITKHTRWPNYRIYIWNNAVKDAAIEKSVRKFPRTKLFQADPGEKLAHPHAVPLQRLYERARRDKAKYIVTMDSDAFPIKDGWLQYLVGQLDEETVLAGVWRDELKAAVTPYIHPSCLCTTVPFIEANRLRLDTIDYKSKAKIDTLAAFSHTAEKLGKRVFKLERSNKNQLHYIMGGVYGDLIYHQGAGSREITFFWGEEQTERLGAENRAIKQALSRLVFRHNDELIDWLTGNLQIENKSNAFFTELSSLEKDLKRHK